jgi:hypothetical protein
VGSGDVDLVRRAEDGRWILSEALDTGESQPLPVSAWRLRATFAICSTGAGSLLMV